MNRPDENEDKFDHDPDGTGWEVNTNEMTPEKPGPQMLRMFARGMREGSFLQIEDAMDAAASAWEVDLARIEALERLLSEVDAAYHNGLAALAAEEGT